MKRNILFASLLLVPAFLFAHGVEVSDVTAETSGTVRTGRFMYSTGEPMAYAAVHIFSPSTPDAEILQAITDRNGYFSFVPDEPGEWRIDVEDGMGHKGSITIPVSSLEGGSVEAASSGNAQRAPLIQRLLLGLSLILNAFAVYGFIVHRRKTGGANHAH